MSIEYINKDGAVVTGAAEKIELVSQERRARVNKFVPLRAIGEQREAFAEGGGIYRFEQLQGMAAATRRGGVNTGNTYEYGNNISVSDLTLTISEPLETPNGKLVPTSRSDVAQLDGIDFTPIASAKTMNVLVDGEIMEDQDKLFTVVNQREVFNTTAGDYFEFYNTIHSAVSDYFDISPENTNWTDPKSYSYFDAGRYQMEREDIMVFINPVDSANMSKALVEKGITTGDMAYTDYKTGQVRMINGVGLVESRYVPKGKAGIFVKGQLGTADPAVIYTMIKTTEDAKGNLGTYGKHYYNSILLFGELATIVSIEEAVVLPGEVKAAQKELKAADKDLKEAMRAEIKAELEAEAKAKAEAKRLEKVEKETEARLKAEAEAKLAKEAKEAAAKAARDAAAKLQTISN